MPVIHSKAVRSTADARTSEQVLENSSVQLESTHNGVMDGNASQTNIPVKDQFEKDDALHNPNVVSSAESTSSDMNDHPSEVPSDNASRLGELKDKVACQPIMSEASFGPEIAIDLPSTPTSIPDSQLEYMLASRSGSIAAQEDACTRGIVDLPAGGEGEASSELSLPRGTNHSISESGPDTETFQQPGTGNLFAQSDFLQSSYADDDLHQELMLQEQIARDEMLSDNLD